MITVYRGDSWPLVIIVRNARTGAVVNVTGFSFKLTVDRNQNPTASPSTTKVFDVAGVVTNGAAGEVTFTRTSANHATAGEFYYDIQLTNASGNVKTIKKDLYIITQNITK